MGSEERAQIEAGVVCRREVPDQERCAGGTRDLAGKGDPAGS
jgi:hypothetical protein